MSFEQGSGSIAGNVTALRTGAGAPSGEEKKDSKPGKRARRARTGRTDHAGQEAVINQTLLREKLPHLVKLIKAKEEAAADLSDAVKKIAEQTGYLAKVVLRRAKAEASDNYADRQKEVVQLALAFEADTPFLKDAK